MGIMPKTGLRTPAEFTDPFHEVFDDEFATDIDNFIDANAADLKQILMADSRDQLPWYDKAADEVRWGVFTIRSPRYPSSMTVSVAGSASMTGNGVLYVQVPAQRPYSGVVVPTVGALPQTQRDRVVIGVLITGVGFFLVGRMSEDLVGYGPGPGLVRHIDLGEGPTTIASSESGALFIIDADAEVVLPTPSSKKESYFLKCNGTELQYFTISGALGTLGFIGPHERLYGPIIAPLNMYGGGGLLRLVAHEPVPGSGEYGWLVRGETGRYQNSAEPGQVWDLGGGTPSPFSPHIGLTPPPYPVNGSLWFYTSANWNIWMTYDESRDKWLSIETEVITWGHDTANGNAMRCAGIDVPSVTSKHPLARNCCVVGVTAMCSGGADDIGFVLRRDNQGVPTEVHQFAFGSGIYEDLTLSESLTGSDDLWVHALPHPSASLQVVVKYYIKSEYIAPPS